MIKGLYAITDEILTPKNSIIDSVKKAIDGGISILQLRDKNSTDEELLDLATKLNNLCKKNRVTFIVNDRLNLALKVDADGVHIGKDDLDLNIVKEKFGNKIIGVSCYGNLDLAINAQNSGASYVAFGACFSSSTKPNAPTIDLNIFTKAKEILDIPICAIGGITTKNASLVKQKGADSIAVINSIWSGDIRSNASNLSNLF